MALPGLTQLEFGWAVTIRGQFTCITTFYLPSEGPSKAKIDVATLPFLKIDMATLPFLKSTSAIA